MSTDWSSLVVFKITTSTAGRLATLVGVIWLTLQSSASPAEALALTGKKGTVWYDWGQLLQTVVNNARNKNGFDDVGDIDDQTVLLPSELDDFSNVPVFPPPALSRSLDDRLIANSRPLTSVDVEQKAQASVSSRRLPTTNNVHDGEYVDRLVTPTSWLNELLQNNVERLNRTLMSTTERNDDKWPNNFKPVLDRTQARIDKRHVPQQLDRFPRNHHHHHQQQQQHHQDPDLLLDAATMPLSMAAAGAAVESGDNWEAEWGVSHPVCPSRTQWSLLRFARDIYGNEVEVYQPSHDANLFVTPKVGSRRKRRSAGNGGEESGNSRRTTHHVTYQQQHHHHQLQQQQQHGAVGLQWFYTVSCYNDSSVINKRACPGCCFGIDHSRFLSSCRQRKSLTMALIRRPDERRFHFDWIQVNSSCSCAVVNKELFEPEYEDEIQ